LVGCVIGVGRLRSAYLDRLGFEERGGWRLVCVGFVCVGCICVTGWRGCAAATWRVGLGGGCVGRLVGGGLGVSWGHMVQNSVCTRTSTPCTHPHTHTHTHTHTLSLSLSRTHASPPHTNPPGLRGPVGEQHGGAVGPEDAVWHEHGAVLAGVPGGGGWGVGLGWVGCACACASRGCAPRPRPPPPRKTTREKRGTSRGPGVGKTSTPGARNGEEKGRAPVVGDVLVGDDEDVGVGAYLQDAARQVDGDQRGWGGVGGLGIGGSGFFWGEGGWVEARLAGGGFWGEGGGGWMGGWVEALGGGAGLGPRARPTCTAGRATRARSSHPPRPPPQKP
jgi:hypothetical protein